MTPDELHHRWDLMLAQAQRFAGIGTYLEAVFRAERLVAEMDERLGDVPAGPTRIKLETLATQARHLLEVWRGDLARAGEEAAARGARERDRELEPPDYEALMAVTGRRSGRAA